MKYFAKIKYSGRRFHGFQAQKGLRTVQGELTSSLSSLFGAPVQVTGCSRTDAGVHAIEFCITIETDGADIPPDKLPMASQQFLPEDISIFYTERCDPGFHPRYAARGKEYVYKILNESARDPFLVGYAWHLPRKIDDNGLLRMKRAAEHIVGKHDFTSFMSEGSRITDAVRTVTSLDVSRDGGIIKVTVSADGFLYNMVRIIVGTLTDIAFGRMEPEDMPHILDSKDRASAGTTAPPDGLYLNRVFY